MQVSPALSKLNDTKNSSNDTKTVQNDTKNSDMIAPDFNVSKSTPNESKTVLNGPKTTQNNTKHTKSESNSGLIDGSIDGSKPNDHHNDRQKEARAINDILNKLLENPNAIIRKTSKTSKTSHIRERCEKADGKTIKDALKIEYTYDDELCTYSKTDMKYDYKKSWIIIESPSSGGAVDIEFNSDEESDGSPAVGGGPSNENNIDPPGSSVRALHALKSSR